MTLPASINGIVSGRAVIKSEVQVRNDIYFLMKLGNRRIDRILRSATNEQKTSAREEYRKYRLPAGSLDRCTKFTIIDKVPTNNAVKLFILIDDLKATLGSNGVYLPKELRDKINNLIALIIDCKADYESEGSNKGKFRFARCYRLKSKMESIARLSKVSQRTQRLLNKI